MAITVVWRIKNNGNRTNPVTNLNELINWRSFVFDEISVTITYEDVLEGQGLKKEIVYYITAIIELHIKQIFIKAGKYWYPFDLTPDFQRRGNNNSIN